MSIFYARSALKFVELLLWFHLWFGGRFEIHVATLLFSLVIREQKYCFVYHSQPDKLQRWTDCQQRQSTDRNSGPVDGKFHRRIGMLFGTDRDAVRVCRRRIKTCRRRICRRCDGSKFRACRWQISLTVRDAARVCRRRNKSCRRRICRRYRACRKFLASVVFQASEIENA